MKVLYRTAFEVHCDKEFEDLIESVAELCWAWVFGPKRNLTVQKSLAKGTGSVPRTKIGPDTWVESKRFEENGELHWGLRFTHPDRTDPAFAWHTELTLTRTKDGATLFSCALYISRRDGTYAPINRYCSRPRIVADILKAFKGEGIVPLSAAPIIVRDTDSMADLFVRFLEDPRRALPIVFVSVHDQSQGYLFDSKRLADHLAGLAYVLVASNSAVTKLLAKRLPQPLTAFDGAVRLYWPGFTRKSNPYDHPLWTSYRVMQVQNLGRDAFGKRLLEQIAGVAAFSLSERFLSWSGLEEMERQRAIAQAKDGKEFKELCGLFEDEWKAAVQQCANLKAEIQSKSEELYKSNSRIAALEAALGAKGLTGNEADQLLPVGSVAEAIERAATRFGNQLVFALNSKSEGDDSPFQPAQEVLTAFEWLATKYHASKLGKFKCTDFDHNVREVLPTWGYSGHQSDLTTGRYKEWYECQWESRPYKVTEHIGSGRSTSPGETIRIAFTFDKSRKKVVIGYIGQHQKNTRS
jgi:hypothetical protein